VTGRAEFFWRLLAEVRVEERSRFLYFAGLFTFITLAQTLGLAGTEALFLSTLGAKALPTTFIVASLGTVAASVIYAFRVGVVRNDLMLMHMLIAFAAFLGLVAWGIDGYAVFALPVLYTLWLATQTIFQNHFWTFSGDYFDRLANKRLVPLFTLGSSLGGALGGLLGALLAWQLGPMALLAAWGVGMLGTALMLRAGRRPLRRWGPLALEEEDETSVSGLRRALRYLGTSSLARWLVVAALGMVLAFFLAQYLYSDIFAERYSDAVSLAIFLSLYLAITNAIEVVFELWLTPRLIRLLGVPGANLMHPGVMFLSFGFLAASQGMAAGIFARVSRELLDNAVAAPVRSLIQNAIPSRFRGRIRAFLEGMVVYAGMAVAGLVLLLFEAPSPFWLCVIGALASLVYLFASWRARRAYLMTLLEQLRAGKLDIGTEGEALGAWEAERLAELWEAALAEEHRWPSASLTQLVPMLAQRGILDPLVRAASHPSPAVRRASVTGLAAAGGPAVVGPLALALDDTDAGVRLSALRGLVRAGPGAFLESRIDDLLQDLDPAVRAEAASVAGEPGREVLAKMIASPQPADATAALRLAPPELIESALARVNATDPQIRATALECLARIASEPPLEMEELLELLRDDDPRVRRAAALVLANIDDEDALRALASCVTDPANEVQLAAEMMLAGLGGEGVAAVEPYLGSESERAVESALRAVARSSVPDARQILSFELRRRVGQMWWNLAAYQLLPREPSIAAEFLSFVCRDAMLRERRLAFTTLELLENPTVIQKVERELWVGTSLSRADALEVLSNLGDRQAASLLVLVHETGPVDERLRIVSGMVALPTELSEVLATARRSELSWLRRAAEAYASLEGEPSDQEETMQRLLALKRVGLFSNLSLEQLEAVNQATHEAEYLPGEIILRENEQGEMLYLLLEGTVEIVKGHGTPHQRRLAEMSAVAYFGEMAILDNSPRSATCLAKDHARLLTLDGPSLKTLILQMPEISFAIFPTLTARLRAAEDRLSEVESQHNSG
jgi:HEAT repeat protein